MTKTNNTEAEMINHCENCQRALNRYDDNDVLIELGEVDLDDHETALYDGDDYYDEPDIDDSVRFCPECETPNQFGELCNRCQREIEMEANQ